MNYTSLKRSAQGLVLTAAVALFGGADTASAQDST